MSENKLVPSTEGWQPVKKGYQPSPSPMPAPTGDNVQGGYQPTTSEAKPASIAPPKKP